MTLIKFNKVEKKIIYPILAMLTHLTNMLFVVISGDSLSDQKDKNNNYLIFLLIITFSEASTLLLYYIQRRNTVQAMKGNLELLPGTVKNKIISLLIIILIVCINFVTTVIQLYIFQNNFLEFLEKIVNGLSLVVATILCAIILNYRYYKHHVLGLLILLTGHTLFSVYDLLETNEFTKFPKPIYIILFIVLYIWVSVQEVLEKYLMEKQFLSPYSIIGLEGVFGIILMCFVFIIISFTTVFDVNFSNFTKVVNLIMDNPFIIVIDILFLLSVFAYNIFRLLTNQFYYPTYICISTVFGDFFKWVCTIVIVLIAIFLKIDDKEETKETSIPPAFEFIIKFLAYGFMIFGILLYLEIIELNIFELNANTKESIMERTDKELDEKMIAEITLCEDIGEENEEEDEEEDDKTIQ